MAFNFKWFFFSKYPDGVNILVRENGGENGAVLAEVVVEGEKLTELLEDLDLQRRGSTGQVGEDLSGRVAELEAENEDLKATIEEQDAEIEALNQQDKSEDVEEKEDQPKTEEKKSGFFG